MTREEFEREFNSRTLAYIPGYRADDRAVVVRIGGSGHTEPGHALVSALVDQLARAHRRIRLIGDLNQPLLSHDPLGATTLREATLERALAINPFIDIADVGDVENRDTLLSIGVGCDAELRVGAEGWCARFGHGAEVDSSRTSLLGTALAATLAAAAAFHRQLGTIGLPHGSYSLWEYGRAVESQGPLFEGPLDVGDVLQAGAGAVACGLDYWISIVGLQGRWTIVDGDDVDVSNLNRQVAFTALDAGFPDGTPINKAVAVARALGENAHPEPLWADRVPYLAETVFDVILPLANERGVRAALQMRSEPLLLHATTTPNWAATVHRHIAGRDDCIVCRIPEEREPRFTCSTGAVGATKAVDASLPFLSVGAGVLLLAELVRLQLGRLGGRQSNNGILDFSQPTPLSSAYEWSCRTGCRSVAPATVRRKLAGHTRWSSLDVST